MPQAVVDSLKFRGAVGYANESDLVAAINADHAALMNFFCHEWGGRRGNLNGCAVDVMPPNFEAVSIFSATGPGTKPTDIEAAMRFESVSNFADCWQRVKIINSEFLKGRNHGR